MSRSAGLPTWEQIHACPGPTPSYHLLPPQVPRRVGSQRSYAESLVLNDDLVSQTIGSEDFSFNVMLVFDDEKQHMRRNQYEDALFRCEDDRFEADVILETTRSAAAQLESLERELQTGSRASAEAARRRAVGGAAGGDSARVQPQRRRCRGTEGGRDGGLTGSCCVWIRGARFRACCSG